MSNKLRFLPVGVGNIAAKFNKKFEDHKNSQLHNPFSEWHKAQPRRLSKDDENYGRPVPGSQSERRAEAARHFAMEQICYLCDMIWDCAEWKSQDGRAAITFGKLFKLYNAISDKVVGTLLRARKHGYVNFEGEMLYQRRDDDKVIELNYNINTIRQRFGKPLVLCGGGEPEIVHDALKNRRNSSAVASCNSMKLQQKRNSLPGNLLFQHKEPIDTSATVIKEEEEEESVERNNSTERESETLSSAKPDFNESIS